MAEEKLRRKRNWDDLKVLKDFEKDSERVGLEMDMARQGIEPYAHFYSFLNHH